MLYLEHLSKRRNDKEEKNKSKFIVNLTLIESSQSGPADRTDLLTDPGVDKLSNTNSGCAQLLRILRTVRVHVSAVGGPGDVDGRGGIVEVLQDPHGVPGVDTAMDKHHVAHTWLESTVLDVGVGNVVGQHLVVELLSESVRAPSLKEVQREGTSVDGALLCESLEQVKMIIVRT